MSLLNKGIAGFAGSIVLTIVHQLFKSNMNNVPNLDQVGEKALQESLEVVDSSISDEQILFTTAMAGNIVGNAVLFSSLAASQSVSKMIYGTLGATAIGAGGSISMADKLLLDNEATDTSQKKWMTTGYYILGSLVTMGVYNLLEKNSKK